MKTKFRNRILALSLALLMLVSIMPIQALASAASGSTSEDADAGVADENSNGETIFTPIFGEDDLVGFPSTFRNVASAAELETALADGIDAICITADFSIDRTFYITKDTIVYSESAITLTRSPDFAGDVFVIGQDSENNLCEEKVTLSIGGFNGDTSGGLTINGNSENMTVDVVGTVFFVCPLSQADLYDNLTVTNCKKVGNERTTNEIYGIPASNAAAVGGAVAITSKSSYMNIYGGQYTNNTVNTSGSSIYGGMFYNYATMYVYGGVFEDGSANRAGAFYNYRSLYIYSATIRNNSASANGGAIYLPASSSARLYLGGNNELVASAVLFSGNTSGGNGGAVFASGRISGQDATFENNSADNGGAIYVYGVNSALNLTSSAFNGNSVLESGGAIFATGHNTLNIDNDISLLRVSFDKNSAKSGAAIAIANTSCAYIKSSSFKENTATSYGGVIYSSASTLTIDKVEAISNSAATGGAIYLCEASTALVNKLDAQSNNATGNGGAIYSIESTLTVYNSNFSANTGSAGSAVYLTTNAITSIYGSSFSSNVCHDTNAGNAGALYVYTGATNTLVHSCTFVQNSSAGLGGAILANGKAIIELYNITAIDNSALKGGFMYETSASTKVTLSGLTVSGNTASVGGPIIWGNTTNAKLFINKNNYVDLDVEGALPSDYWSGAIYNKLTVSEINTAIPSYTDYSGILVDGLWSATIVTTFDELKAAVLAGKPYIKIVNDITISETLYITADTVIFSTTPCVLTRADGFGGNLFVVGRNAEGELTQEGVTLTLGLSTSALADMLTINCGEGSSAIVVASGSQINIYDNVTVSGAKGTDGSAITVEENATANIYGGKIENNVSTGNGAILNNGTLNVNGGTVSGNIAELGGAIYSVGTLNVHGGTIENNTARLGGAIYNLGTLTTDGGSIRANSASENGGAIYMAGGTAEIVSEISENTSVLGGAIYCADGTVTLKGAKFTSNIATNGGAIYIDNATVSVELLNATFNGNSAELGGALYLTNNDFDVNDCIFVENSATSGGAIYVENVTLNVSNSTFKANSAKNGGAIYTNASPVKLNGITASSNKAQENGGVVFANAATVTSNSNMFSSNEADKGAAIYVLEGTLSSTADIFEYGYAFEGGAIYADHSELTVSGSEFTGNDADYNGGAIALLRSNAYINNVTKFTANSAANDGGAISATNSKLTVYGTIFNTNTALLNGGAISANSGSTVKIYTSAFTGNVANKNGGAINASDDGTTLTVQLCEFTSNKAKSFGGVIYLSSKAVANVYNISATKNNANRGAVLYITGAGTTANVNGVTVTSNTATGTFVYGDAKDAVLNINKSTFADTVNDTTTVKYWEAALYGTLTINTIYDDIPEYIEEGNEPAGDLSKAFDVSNASELEAALVAGRKHIRIVADFEIDRTFYITYGVTIFSTAKHTLTRAPGFGGDIFVVGEHADGTNSMLKKADARLTLGNPSSDTPSLLTIDGNKDNMTVDVTGTVLFICNGASADVYENISIINCHKTGNVKTHDARYKLSRPNRIGGPVAIIPFGGLNIYGGAFKNNSVALEDTSSEETRNSTLGGVFYNESNLKIYGGIFENNEGARGGIVYNYGTIKIYGGSFIGNRATVSGGIYYSPASATCQLNIGYNSTTPILFKNNTARLNGGVIYSTTVNGIVIYGNTTFENNSALTGSGGVVYTSSTFTVMNATFSGNSAKSRGGAIFTTRSTDEILTRFMRLENCSFIGNSATTGGALSMYCSDSDFASGSVVDINNCEFISNTAASGGAISVERKSILTVNGSKFDANSSTGEAGAIYIISESTAKIYNSTISGGNAGSHGGAICVRSATLTLDSSTVENNHSEKNAGAIYVAYSSDIDRNAKVTVKNSTIRGNSADNGGAIYATRRAIENDTEVLTVSSTDFANNTAIANGGAVLLTAGVDVFMKDVTFVANQTTRTSEGAGGAIAVNNSTLEIDGGVFTKNYSAYTGGAMNLGTSSNVILNNVTASRNSARTHGGFLYNTFGTLTVYNSTINNNSANMGAGIYLYEGAVSNIYNTKFIANSTGENGAALFIYTNETKTLLNGCTFERNNAANYGGGLYVSSKSIVEMYNITAINNSASKGGFMYETTTGTVVTLASLTVSNNSAANGGNIIWGNSKGAELNIDKTKYTDLDVDTALDDTYWASAIFNSLTVNDTSVTVPKAATYTSYVEPVKNTVGKASAAVNDVFDLAKNSSDGYINSTYDKFPVLDNSSNFMSRGTTVFENINGGTVTVDTFVYPKYSTAHNMTVGEALMIYQAMLYKQAYPDEDVYIDISAYRFSVQTAVNINRNSRYFGYTRALVDSNYDEFGFVRVSYLLVSAAKMGIHVNVLAHRDAYPISASSKIPSTFETYFANYINDYCDPAYEPYGTIGDYLDYCYFDWTLSDGGKGGTDMMHTKLCAVSHYIDMNGNIHKNAVWTSSSNLDGIYGAGYNANWKLQTATIISDHEDIYRISVNYLRMMPTYDYQEGIIEFQNYMNVETTKQIDLIMEGRGDEIPKNKRLVYIGTENDDVFELYFTPFGGDILSWSEKYNPYCKYLRELYDSEDYIIFTWNAAEYSGGFPLGQQIEQMIIDAFHKNKNPNNKIYANMESFDPTTFDDLEVGVDIGFKSINEWPLGAIHNKDLQFSYVKNGQRYYVSLLNSLNLHSGSMYYQSNSALVIKEKTCSENSVFSIVAKYSTNTQLVTHTFTETERDEVTETEHGYVYRVCSCCGHKEIIETLHYPGEWIIEKVATPTENGIRYRKCIICDDIIETEETKYNGSTRDPNFNTGTTFTGSTIIPITVGGTPQTFEATLTLDKAIDFRGGVIIGNYTSPENENAISIEIFTHGKVRLFYLTNGIKTDIVFSEDIRSTEPVHIAITVSESYATLYVNGRLSESIEINNPLPVIDRAMTIGGDFRDVMKQTFRGKIYSVALFGDVRTADEILTDMEYVSETAPDVLYSTYFNSSDAPSYVIGNTTTGKNFTQKELVEIEIAESIPSTFEITLMLPTNYADRAGVIFGNYTDGTKDTLNLEVMAGGKLRLYYINSGVKYDYTFTTDIRSDKPINLALTVNENIVSMYINGVLVETIEVSGALPTIQGNFGIGGDYRAANAQYFKGTIYSLNIFSTVRTEDEILGDMLAVNQNADGLIYSARFTEKGILNGTSGQTFDKKVVGGVPCVLNSTPKTFEATVNLSKKFGDRGGVIIGNYSSPEDKNAISIEVYTRGKVRLFYLTNGIKTDIVFSENIRSNGPVHIAITVDANKATLYVNGRLSETVEIDNPLPTIDERALTIGGDYRASNTQYFKGTIYSVALFDHVRTAEQISDDMIFCAEQSGLLFSTVYINTSVKTERDIHSDLRFETVTAPTKDSEGVGRLVCHCCGKILEICSIPYTADTVIKNTYTDKNSALKDGEYFVVEDKFTTAPKTFEFLLKLSPNFNDRGGVVAGNYDGTANGRMNIEIYTNGNPRLWYKIGGKGYSYLFDVDIRSNEAVHLALTIDGLTASLYVNGELADTVTLTVEVPFDGSNFYIGTDQRITAQSFKGEIYSAGIFSDVRTPEEIAHDMIMITSDAHALLFYEYFVASEGIQAKGPWADKNAIFVGDSITAGTGCEGDTYWQLLQELLELKSATAMGVPESCISSTSDYGNNNDPLANRYSDIPEADLITIFMGTNDYGHDTPIGTINDEGDVSFYGALNTIIPELLAKYPDAKIVFITPIHRYGFGTNSATGETHTFDSVPNGAGHTLEDYANAIKAACDKYGIDVIDLYNELDIDPSAEETREYYMTDGLHPTTAGHRQIAELLEHALIELCKEAE